MNGVANSVYKYSYFPLCIFDDIDYSEPVEFLVPPVPDDEIKAFLIDKATDIF
jgi:hypothetical protein